MQLAICRLQYVSYNHLNRLSSVLALAMVMAFVLIYKHLVRSHLEYNNSVWAPYRKSDIDKLEKVHKRATKW